MSSALCQMPQGCLVRERVAQQGPAWPQRLRNMPFIAVAGKKSGLWNHAWPLPAATRLVLFDKKAAKYLMQALLNKHRAVL